MRRLLRPASHRRLFPALAVVLALALDACAGGRPVPPEMFDWRGAKVSFSPPPRAWRRVPVDLGGWVGVRFELRGPRGSEWIAVADWAHFAPPGGAGGESDQPLAAVVEPARPRPKAQGGWRIVSEGDTTVAGRPAFRVDTEWRPPGGPVFRGRELYVVAGRHLFVAQFEGLERSLRVFDRVVGSISFPDSTAPAVTEPRR